MTRLKVFCILLLLSCYCNCSFVNPNLRVDCHPDPGASKEKCEARNCLWDPNTEVEKRVPFCHFPPNVGYNYINVTKKHEIDFHLIRKSAESVKSPFGEDEDYYQFVGLTDLKQTALIGLVPTDFPVPRSGHFSNLDGFSDLNEGKITVEINKDPLFSFTVKRADNEVKILDISSLILGKQYIQFSTLLPTNKIIGFGEHTHFSLTHDLSKYTTWPMFARDQPPNAREENQMNLYGVHNFYLGIEHDGRAHGVVVLNPFAQEVTTGPGPHLTYRFIGGPVFMNVFVGETPEEVVREYHKRIGYSYLPAYWAFGYQFSRFGYKNATEFARTVERIYLREIPIDVVYADIDYMSQYKDFTYDKENWKDFPDMIRRVHDYHIKLTLIFDPAIEVDYEPFERAIQSGVNFISWPNHDMVQHEINNLYSLTRNTTIMLGTVWPNKHVAFPNFFNTEAEEWWIEEFKRFHEEIPFDGIWIDMNEPSNFGTEIKTKKEGKNKLFLRCPPNELELPPYKTWAAYTYGENTPLCHNTLCMSGILDVPMSADNISTFYEVKNLYGHYELRATSDVMARINRERAQVISRSTFPGSGAFGGHWLGDNSATWPDLRSAIIGAQEFNIFGITHVGSDVCGFNGPSNEELCLRWHQLGAFHSFYRNHNSDDQPPQDPTQWESVTIATKAANLFRYQHLPQLYTMHFLSNVRGGTVVRPLLFEFPQDNQALTESYNFLWGSSLLICPVTTPFTDEIRVYLPIKSDWFSLYPYKYGQQIPAGFNTVPAPRNSSLPVFLRGGSIIPRQTPAMTTHETRENNIQLVVAISQHYFTASGELVWDDGVALRNENDIVPHYEWTFDLSTNEDAVTLTIKQTKRPKTEDRNFDVPLLDQLEFFGFNSEVGLITINGGEHKHSKDYNRETKHLVLTFSEEINIQESKQIIIKLNKQRKD